MANAIHRERLESFIKAELARYLRTAELPGFARIATITAVRLSDELSVATVYVDTVDRSRVQAVVAQMTEFAGVLRTDIAKKLNTRRCPALRFEADATIDYALRIDDVLRKAKGEA